MLLIVLDQDFHVISFFHCLLFIYVTLPRFTGALQNSTNQGHYHLRWFLKYLPTQIILWLSPADIQKSLDVSSFLLYISDHFSVFYYHWIGLNESNWYFITMSTFFFFLAFLAAFLAGLFWDLECSLNNNFSHWLCKIHCHLCSVAKDLRNCLFSFVTLLHNLIDPFWEPEVSFFYQYIYMYI